MAKSQTKWECFMKTVIYDALWSYFKGQLEKHRANIQIHIDNPTGVAEHSDHIETLEKEIGLMAEYDEKIDILERYFKGRVKDKEVING
jgi:hypothetical protein